jgi:hypothetical protein
MMMSVNSVMLGGQHVRVPWPHAQPRACMPSACSAPDGSASTCMGQPTMRQFSPCHVDSSVANTVANKASSEAFAKPAASVGTWSTDPAETAMPGMHWDDVDMLQFAAEEEGDALHHFSEELLGEDDMAGTGGIPEAEVPAGKEGAEATGKGAASVRELVGEEMGGGCALSWMDDDEYLLDDGLGSNGVCLGMMA